MSSAQAHDPQPVIVIGAGVVGCAVAWLLQSRGHAVSLVDSTGHGPQIEEAGSSAALGLLMAQVYRRSSGRGWRLRQRSHSLWHQWRQQLEARGHAIPWRPGLVQLAQTGQELAAQARLVNERQHQGIQLQLLSQQALEALTPPIPKGAVGGLLSPQDGQLDPIPAMAALRADGLRLGLQLVADQVVGLERLGDTSTQRRWRLRLAGGGTLEAGWLVVCAGLGSPALLEPLGHSRPQNPVLGQALELQLPAGTPDPCLWPGSISWGGVNLVPRPGGRLWLGATLETDAADGRPDPASRAAALEQMRHLGGSAPDWLEQATPLRHWQGLRARPDGRPAPLLEQLEPGLLLASGHYRNGVLLAPASAEWAAAQIEARAPTDP